MVNSTQVSRVQQLTKDIVRINPKHGFDVSVMVGAAVQAIISDGEDTFVIKLEPPEPGQSVRVSRNEDGTVDVVYEAA